MKVAKENNINTTWFPLLDGLRNYFIHQATINIAVKLPEKEGKVYELIIMKEFLKKFDDKTKYLYLQDLNEIIYGIRTMLPLLEDQMVKDINKRFGMA